SRRNTGGELRRVRTPTRRDQLLERQNHAVHRPEQTKHGRNVAHHVEKLERTQHLADPAVSLFLDSALHRRVTIAGFTQRRVDQSREIAWIALRILDGL